MQWNLRSTRSVLPIVAGALLTPAAASAQDIALSPSDTAVAQQLAQSEARVRALQQRVERLESRLDALMNARTATAQPPAAAAPVAQTAQASPPATGAPPPGAARTGRPGTFEIDEDAAQRALERTLTQTGALLLPPGAFMFTPAFNYTRSESVSTQLAQVTDPNTGTTGLVLVDQPLRRNEYSLRATLKAGLPWDSQLEVEVPYHYVSSTRRNPLAPEEGASGSGAGDASIGIAKTLLREKGHRPDLIGRLTWNTGTGRRADGRVGLTGGNPGLLGEIVALKRQDPLAFFASATYGAFEEDDGFRPGDYASLSFGTVLAASPATSLQLGFTQIRRGQQERLGVKQSGTDQTYGVLSLGGSSVLSRDVMLITSVGVGVGEDAPDYSINFSLPITFR